MMIAGLAAAVFFVWLSLQMVSGNLAAFDLAVRSDIHAYASPRLTYLMRSVTQMGEPWFLVMLGLLVAVILMRRGRVRAALPFVTATVGGELANTVLKLGFHRPRPEAFFGLPQPIAFSFPSGHAMVSTCFFGGLAILVCGRRRQVRYWVAAGLIAGLIGFSRIYLGVHYPSDVLGGYAAGIVVLALVYGRRRVTCEIEQPADSPQVLPDAPWSLGENGQSGERKTI
jgi:membrane-associated phospholipid phosphatase